jgi:predicted AlkP superfamily pyrophosphatase or phosphodiesterase
LRLDRELGEFFNFLDREVGKGRYTIALSADHGAAEVPEYQKEVGKTGRRITEKEMDALLGGLKDATVNRSDSPQGRRARVASLTEKYDFIADAMTIDDLSSDRPGSIFIELYRNSFYPGRAPIYPIVSHKYPSLAVYDIRVRLMEGAVPYFAPSNHGSPYFYDRNVALIFMGPGIRKGFSMARARTVDVAPTLAQLGNIAVPVEIDGHSLLSALRKR